MKRIFSVIVLLFVLSFSEDGYAANWGGFEYTYENSTLTIDGEGFLPDDGPWNNAASVAKKVIFGSKIEYTNAIFLNKAETLEFEGSYPVISSWALESNKKLSTVIIKGKDPIATGEWMQYSRLKSIILEDPDADYVRDGAFLFNKDKTILYYWFDSKKADVVIPEGVTEIGSCTFANSNVKSVTFPSTLQTIRSYAFYNCKKLKEITLPESFDHIGRYAFHMSGITKIEFLCNHITVDSTDDEPWLGDGGWELAGTKLKEIKLPKCNQITDGMFAYNFDLTEVEIENGTVSTLGLQTTPFEGCKKLKSVYIPESLSNADYRWFYNAGLSSKFMLIVDKDSPLIEMAKTYNIKYIEK